MPLSVAEGQPGQDAGPVALLHPTYWPEVRRGSERFIHELGARLAARGFRPRLLTSRAGSTTRTVEDGLEVVRRRRPAEPPLHRIGVWEYTAHLPGTAVELIRARPPLVHAVYPTDAMLATLPPISSTPLILSVMGVPARSKIESVPWRERLWRRITSRADRVVFLSRAAAHAGRWLCEGDVIYPGVDLDRFSPGGHRTASPSLFAPAAIDDPRKRIRLLVEAVDLLRSRGAEVTLRLGAPRPGAQLPLPLDREWIELVNLDRHEVLLDSYRRAHLTVHPAEAEAFGLVIVESMAAGTPVVAADDGASRELIPDRRAGRVFEEATPECIAAEISRALESPPAVEECVRNARRFDAEATADRYAELYRTLLGRSVKGTVD